MNLATPHPHGRIEFATSANAGHLSRLAKSGTAVRLAPGVYVVGATLPLEAVTRHHLWTIVEHYFPGAVIIGRSALAGGQPVEGVLYVGHPGPARKQPLQLPGCRVVAVVAPGALPGDTSMPGGLHLSGPARQLVENVSLEGRPPRHRAGSLVVEDKIDELARSGGVERVRKALAQLDVIESSFDPRQTEFVRRNLAAVLGTVPDGFLPRSPGPSPRLSGLPYDSHRLDLLDGLIQVLQKRAPAPVVAYPPTERWEWLSFFEAYFSNFIEGTEFEVDEARRIAIDGLVPESRPLDAHDVAATYRLAADPDDRILVPSSGEELIELLRTRHRVLMGARTDKRPGEFKSVANRAGSYHFVVPELVRGTLVNGFERIRVLQDPFARATAMMLLVTECHPFDDGNGRLARLMSNAELSHAGEVRLMIPSVYRGNYLSALRGTSLGAGQGQSLVAVLGFAQRWVAAVDWTTYEGAKSVLTACHAFDDEVESGTRLEWPAISTRG